MQRFVMIAVLLGLSACGDPGPTLQQKKCSQIGIDTRNPNFAISHSNAEIDAFYPCALQYAEPNTKNTALIFLDILTPDDEPSTRKFYEQNVQYQWNLWHQINAGQITSAAAQQAWIAWDNKQTYAMQQQYENYRALQASKEAIDLAPQRQEEIRKYHGTRCTGDGKGNNQCIKF